MAVPRGQLTAATADLTAFPYFTSVVVKVATIRFRLDQASGVPTYLQLVQQTKHAVRYGMLRPGDRLPTAREVVLDLAINPNTVLKAYRELEREGFVYSRPGAGTFVADDAPAPLARWYYVGRWTKRSGYYVSSAVLTVLVVRPAQRRTYLLAGFVTPALLQTAADGLR